MLDLARCVDPDVWDAHVLAAGGHPLQLWGWGELKAAHGWRATRWFAREGGGTVGAAQVLTRRLPPPFTGYAYLPRGPMVAAKRECELLAALAEATRQEGPVVALAVEPETATIDTPAAWRRAQTSVLPAETILLDLTQSEDALLGSMAKKCRQYIRGSAHHIEIRQVEGSAAVDLLLPIYHETARRAGFGLHSDAYYHDAFRLLGEHGSVLFAYSERTPVAFLSLAQSRTTAFELYGGVTATGQRLRANYALKWHAIRACRDAGVTRYDFGGLIPGGVTTFKQLWSPGTTTFAGTFEVPLSPWYRTWTRTLPTARRVLRRLRSIRP